MSHSLGTVLGLSEEILNLQRTVSKKEIRKADSCRAIIFFFSAITVQSNIRKLKNKGAVSFIYFPILLFIYLLSI